MRQFAKIVAVQAIIFVCGLLAIEFALRVFIPLQPHGGIYTDRSGKSVRVAFDSDSLFPNLDVIQSASEFSVSVHTDALGYRKMSNESPAPDFLFLGDSFTFGHGVSDNEVFSEIVCKNRNATCLNLGRSGTDTFDQVRILRHGIEAHHLRPRMVVVIMLAACWLEAAGNDLGDNLMHFRANRQGEREGAPLLMLASSVPSGSSIIKTIQRWIGDFEIAKRVMLIATSRLKGSFYSCSAPSELDAAADATAQALNGLVQLGDQYGFKTVLFVIHPYQELDGAYRTTEPVAARAAPKTMNCFLTGAVFRKEHYFSYDGHFNVSGQANLASIVSRQLASGRTAEVPPAGCRS